MYINFFDQVIKNVRYEENITDDTEIDKWVTFTTTDGSITVEELKKLETNFPDQVKKYDNPPQYRVFGNLQFLDSVNSDSE